MKNKFLYLMYLSGSAFILYLIYTMMRMVEYNVMTVIEGIWYGVGKIIKRDGRERKRRSRTVWVIK